MKQIKIVFIALFLSVVMVFGIAGCNTSSQNELQSKIDNLQSQIAEMEDRLAEMEDQLRERDATIEDLNGQIEKQGEKIEELEKTLAKKTVGAFYSLQGAYDNGWLTQAELMSIAYYHNRGRNHNEEIMSEDYEPLPKTPENLSTFLNLAIRQTMVNDLNKRFDTDTFVLDNIAVYGYCGTYNGCVAIRLSYSDGPYYAENTVINEHTVANVTFFYPNYTSFYYLTDYILSNTIMIWKENS